jgi:hypothetical protein
LPEADNPHDHKNNGDNSLPPSIAESQPHASGDTHPQVPNPKGDNPDNDKKPSYKILWRQIRWLDTINTIATIGMLLVAVAAYRIASDTRDVKTAVKNISDLATQTKRQADALDKQFGQVKREADAAQDQTSILRSEFGEMQSQTGAFQSSATAAQGQLREMRAEQRALIYADVTPASGFQYWGPNGAILLHVVLHNIGHLPATHVYFASHLYPMLQNVSDRDAQIYPLYRRQFVFPPVCFKRQQEARGNVFQGRPVVVDADYSHAETGNFGIQSPPIPIGRPFSLTVLGCVTYTSPGDKRIHHTWISEQVYPVGHKYSDFVIKSGTMPGTNQGEVRFVETLETQQASD